MSDIDWDSIQGTFDDMCDELLSFSDLSSADLEKARLSWLTYVHVESTFLEEQRQGKPYIECGSDYGRWQTLASLAVGAGGTDRFEQVLPKHIVQLLKANSSDLEIVANAIARRTLTEGCCQSNSKLSPLWG